MTEFENYIHRYFNLNQEESRAVAGAFRPEILKKGDYLVRAGGYCNKLSFIEEGILRMYINLPEKEVTQWVSTRESFVTDFSSFFYRTPSLRDIQALTDTRLLTVDYQQHQ